MDYDGTCGTDSTGLYQNSYAGGTRLGLATQLQSTDARKFFPCFDEPAFKATFDMTVTVPSFYTVLFNTPLKEAVSVGGGLTRHSFGATPIMSTYLLALIVTEAHAQVGRTRNGVEIRVWTPVGEKDVGEFPLRCAISAVEYFEAEFGAKREACVCVCVCHFWTQPHVFLRRHPISAAQARHDWL